MHSEIVIRFLLAALWGGMVGIEREYRSKAAGFRTMIMISIGACFFTMLSVWIGVVDHDRIASNIVTGIGFLGAGVIFRGDSRVIGITTAATIWAVAAVGMGIGAGYYFAAACASVLILIVLAVLPGVERKIDQFNRSRTYIIQCSYAKDVKAHMEQRLSERRLRYTLVSEVKEGMKLVTVWQVQGHIDAHEQLADELKNDTLIERLEY